MVANIGGEGLLWYLRPRIQSICVNLYPTNPAAVDDTLCNGILRDSLDPGAINVMISGSKLPPPRTANELLGADFGSSINKEYVQDQTAFTESTFAGPVLVAQGFLDPLNDAKGRAEMFGALRDGIVVNPINAGVSHNGNYYSSQISYRSFHLIGFVLHFLHSTVLMTSCLRKLQNQYLLGSAVMYANLQRLKLSLSTKPKIYSMHPVFLPCACLIRSFIR